MSLDMIQNLEEFVGTQLHLLKPVKDCWQPSDILPDLTGKLWKEELNDLRERALGLSDEVLVVLVGNLVTEEALPSYQAWLNRYKGLGDKTGASLNPWAVWTRSWTAEENRHGEALNKYLYLSGRVNMRSVEVTTQFLIKNGFDMRSEGDLYHALVYASFQERATKISHGNTGRLAEKCGDVVLGRVCSLIAGDEARHEEGYKRFFGKIVELEPSQALMAFAGMMKQRVAMPARLMSDGSSRDIFGQFALAAQRVGVYTTRDYADVIEHLVQYWNIPNLSGLSGEACEAQDYLCNLGEKFRGKVERFERMIAKLPREPFGWIFDRCA